MHGFLYHRDVIMRGFKMFRKKSGQNRDEYPDIHNKLVAAYPEGSHVLLPDSVEGRLTRVFQFPSGGSFACFW